MKNCVNLGCGNKHYTSNKEYRWTNVDNWSVCNPEVVWNLEKTPLPFKNDEFDIIMADAILEHLTNWESFLKELWRICAPQGKIFIEVPNFNYNFYHPYHKTWFSQYTFETFHRFNKQEFFVVEKVCLKWTRSKDSLFLRSFGFFFDFLANFGGSKSRFLCDRVWGYWVGGFEALRFTLSPIKDGSGDFVKSYKNQYLSADAWREKL